ALRREPSERHPSAADFADALGDALDMSGGRADATRIGGWVKHAFGPELDRLRELTAPDLGPPPDDEDREDPTRSLRRSRPEPTPTSSPKFTPIVQPIAYEARAPAAPPKKRSRWPY